MPVCDMCRYNSRDIKWEQCVSMANITLNVSFYCMFLYLYVPEEDDEVLANGSGILIAINMPDEDDEDDDELKTKSELEGCTFIIIQYREWYDVYFMV